MRCTLIDGVEQASKLSRKLAADVEAFSAREGRSPCLAAVLVGDDPASAVYVRNKVRAAEAIGIRSKELRLPKDAPEAEVLRCVSDLNIDPQVDGILVQLPLPAHISRQTIIMAISPEKDVDGLHPFNVGQFYAGIDGMVPCTPYGCMLLIRSVVEDLTGMEAVVIGRSNIVGKPMSYMLSEANATVTLAHSATQDIAAVCRRADIVVSAVGHPEMVRANWIKPGAIVIDVGINRLSPNDRPQRKIVGDVAFDEVANIASAITPVPGGVGPMTIACLLRNTVVAAARRENQAPPVVDWIMDF